MRGGRELTAVVTATVALTACDDELPKDSYGWHPALLRSSGKLDPYVGSLGLGERAVLNHRHPADPESETISIDNARDLMPFINRQTEPLAYAGAYYNGDGGVSGAYAALVKPGATLATKKNEIYVGYSGLVGGPRHNLTFSVRQLQGLLPADHPCKLHYVDSSHSGVSVPGLPMPTSLPGARYVSLSGSKKNLYLELVVPGALTLASGAAYDGPLEVKEDWSSPVLTKLRRIHEKTELDVCPALGSAHK